jgi:hypothetical protein
MNIWGFWQALTAQHPEPRKESGPGKLTPNADGVGLTAAVS